MIIGRHLSPSERVLKGERIGIVSYLFFGCDSVNRVHTLTEGTVHPAHAVTPVTQHQSGTWHLKLETRIVVSFSFQKAATNSKVNKEGKEKKKKLV